MNDHNDAPLHALPDGEAELRLVVRLAWEDVAALGQEASRLAARTKRPVSLDEAASHRLRQRVAGHAKPAQDWPVAAAAPAVSSLTGRTPGEHARQAIEKITASDTPQAPASAPVGPRSTRTSSPSSA
ncbi:hypothetical protein [Streptomyces sp. NPDC088258]|uniref:hypothetical protein n=1 Tax=Streptomyces sp. NPDC088258 TaxID=3365849 RepID=UPI00382BF4BC